MAAKHQFARALHHIKSKCQHQRLQSHPRRIDMIEAIAAQIAIKFGSIYVRKPCAGANFAHNGIERAHRRAARDPMALVIIVAIGRRGIRALKWYAKSLAQRGKTFETQAGGHIDKALRLSRRFNFAPCRDIAIVLFESHRKGMASGAVGHEKYKVCCRRC